MPDILLKTPKIDSTMFITSEGIEFNIIYNMIIAHVFATYVNNIKIKC